MKSILGTTLVLALFISGCEKDIHSELPSPAGVVRPGTTFQLPGPVHRMESYFSGGQRSRQEWRFVESQWQPKGWSLWVAANAYSAYKYPRDDSRNQFVGSGFNDAPAPWDRAKKDGKFLNEIKKFVKHNDVPVEINFLGYDTLPETLIAHDKKWGNGGLKFSYHDTSGCAYAFSQCVDNYFISPTSRFQKVGYTSFKDWVTPYIHFRENDAWGPDNLKQLIGNDGENSVFYDWWPTMVFLVNPEGKVARAWLPQTQGTASVNRVISALIQDMDLKGEIKFDPSSGKDEIGAPIIPSEWSYHGEYFLDAGLRKLEKSIMRVRD